MRMISSSWERRCLAGHAFGGVRPSSGAATSAHTKVSESSDAQRPHHAAAPGDGRAPLLPPARRRRSLAAFTIIECMVYLGVYVTLLGFATMAFYRCYDHMKSMRRNREAISSAVHAGEAWRNDVRRATKPIVFDPADQTLRIQRSDKEVAYRFADGKVLRKSSAEARWVVLLPKVERSEMQADPRAHVTAWRWEVELQTQKKTARVRPLFSFVATPPSP